MNQQIKWDARKILIPKYAIEVNENGLYSVLEYDIIKREYIPMEGNYSHTEEDAKRIASEYNEDSELIEIEED